MFTAVWINQPYTFANQTYTYYYYYYGLPATMLRLGTEKLPHILNKPKHFGTVLKHQPVYYTSTLLANQIKQTDRPTLSLGLSLSLCLPLSVPPSLSPSLPHSLSLPALPNLYVIIQQQSINGLGTVGHITHFAILISL